MEQESTISNNLPLWAKLRCKYGFATAEELKEFEILALNYSDEYNNILKADDGCTSAEEAHHAAYCQEGGKDPCAGTCKSSCTESNTGGCEPSHEACPTNCEGGSGNYEACSTNSEG